MKIVCPLNPDIADHIQECIDLGADEFYLGYKLRGQLKGFAISRRFNGGFPSIESTFPVISNIKKNNSKVFLALNEHCYDERMYKIITNDVKNFIDNGGDGIIVSDINLIMILKKKMSSVYMVASTGCNVSNGNAIDFFAKLGVSRFILPRDLAPLEIRDLMNKGGFEFEVFIKNDKCPNVDGLCRYAHRIHERLPCESLEVDGVFLRRDFRYGACGVCALYDMVSNRNLFLKICGRDRNFNQIRSDIKFIRDAVSCLRYSKDKASYISSCKKKYAEVYGVSCNKNCYY